MHSSYDEIRRLANRALDAGCAAPGIDEDSAHSVAWLEAGGLPGLALLADALDGTDAAERAAGLVPGPVADPECEIDAGGRSAVFYAASVVDLLIALADGPAGAGFVTLKAAQHPLFLAAAAARFCPPEKVITLGSTDFDFRADAAHAVLYETPGARPWTDRGPVDVRAICGPEELASVPTGGCDLTDRIAQSVRDGLTVDDGAFARVEAYAAKILVPETETSRLEGAGAGLTDND